MNNNKLRIFLVALLMMLPFGILFPQVSSPFSRYGIGELKNNGFGRNQAMGGTGIGIKTSSHLNNINPASYTAIDTLSFFFEAVVSGKYQQLSLDGNYTNHSKIDFDCFAFGFPIARFLFTSIGLRPAANNDYSFIRENDNYTITSSGDGNISNLYGGVGLKLTKSLSLGVNVNYLFGDIRHIYISAHTPPVEKYFGAKSEIRINDVVMDFGAQYTFNIDNDKLTIGGIFSPKTEINGKSSWIVGEGSQIDNNNFITLTDTIPDGFAEGKLDAEMPMGFGFGVSYVFDNKLTIAVDYSTKKWGDANLKGSGINFGEITNANYYSAGMEWIPNERTGTKYFERVKYRAGAHYTEDYIKLNGYQVKDMGVSVGLGLPLRRTNTSINVTFDIGTKGTSEKGISKETYGKLSLNFTLHEYWFMKSRIQ